MSEFISGIVDGFLELFAESCDFIFSYIVPCLLASMFTFLILRWIIL